MSLQTTFQIIFIVMINGLMHRCFTSWICSRVCARTQACMRVCVCETPPGQTYLINYIIHFVMRTKLFPDTCWLRVKRTAQTLGNCTYSHLCCTDAVEFPVSGASSLLCHLDKWREQCLCGVGTAPRASFVHTSLYLYIHTTGQKWQDPAAVLPAPW